MLQRTTSHPHPRAQSHLLQEVVHVAHLGELSGRPPGYFRLCHAGPYSGSAERT
jgi:hypothetical protein